MTFTELFRGQKPLIGMIHTDSTDEYTTLELARKEIEIYLKYGVYPLIENYSGLAKIVRKYWLGCKKPPYEEVLYEYNCGICY